VVLTFLSSVILTRLLTPNDFGLIAMVSSCVALVTVVQDLGLTQATIQRDKISQAQLSALFWLATGISVLLAFALALSAPLVASFFGDFRLVTLTVAFALLVFLGGVQSQQCAILCRELRFKALAGIDVIGVVVGFLAGVVVAWLTLSYWALFVANLATSLIRIACLWFVCPLRLSRPSFEGEFKQIMHFGSGVSGFNLVNYFTRNADNLMIGRYYGSEQLGYYDRAYRLLLFPLSQILNPLGGIIIPLLSRTRTDIRRYKKIYAESISLLMIVAQPGIVFATIFADSVFLALFGPKWASAAAIFRVLGVCGLLQVMTSTLGWLYLSQGRGGDFFKLGLFSAAISVTSFVVGLPWGGIGVAMAYTMANYVILAPATFWEVGRRGLIPARELLEICLPHAAATAAAGATLLLVLAGIPAPNLAMCFGLALCSYIIYVGVIIIFPVKRNIILSNVRTLAAMLPFVPVSEKSESLFQRSPE